MKIIQLFILLLVPNFLISQIKSVPRIDIYLARKHIPCWDTTLSKLVPFSIPKQDLQDTAFIKDEEIISYTFRSYYEKGPNYRKFRTAQHTINLSTSISERVEKLNLSLFGCAMQFAIVCNGEIIYSGCLNNKLSSWVPPMIFATGQDRHLYLNLGDMSIYADPREDKRLFKNLKKSHRFIHLRKRESKMGI